MTVGVILGQGDKQRFNTLFLCSQFLSGCVSKMLLPQQSEAEGFCHELHGVTSPCLISFPALSYYQSALFFSNSQWSHRTDHCLEVHKTQFGNDFHQVVCTLLFNRGTACDFRGISMRFEHFAGNQGTPTKTRAIFGFSLFCLTTPTSTGTSTSQMNILLPRKSLTVHLNISVALRRNDTIYLKQIVQFMHSRILLGENEFYKT